MRQLICSLLVGLASGCESSGECSTTADCEAGNVCLDGVCYTTCNSDGECTVDGEICVEGRCEAGSRSHAPVILGVNGDGSRETDPRYTGQRIDNYMTIVGEHLEGAEVSLTMREVIIPLGICESNDTRLRVALPAGVEVGIHTLTVANAVGVCSAQLALDKGADGANASVNTAEEIRDKLQTVDGESSGFDADTLDGVDASELLRHDHLHGDSYAAFEHSHSEYSPHVHDHASVCAESDHFHGQYLGLSNMTVAEANTLRGGASADSLHSHDYAEVGHPHPEFFPYLHDHDADYSLIGHNHPDPFAPSQSRYVESESRVHVRVVNDTFAAWDDDLVSASWITIEAVFTSGRDVLTIRNHEPYTSSYCYWLEGNQIVRIGWVGTQFNREMTEGDIGVYCLRLDNGTRFASVQGIASSAGIAGTSIYYDGE